jgi:biotin synthase
MLPYPVCNSQKYHRIFYCILNGISRQYQKIIFRQTNMFDIYNDLYKKSLAAALTRDDMLAVLRSDSVELLPLLHIAHKIKQREFGNKIRIHILNNAKNGGCSEDCSYCAQSGKAENDLEVYDFKTQEEILMGAKEAHQSGAYRYCIAFSGNTQNDKDIDFICDTVTKIKKLFPLDICISAGFLDDAKALRLKNAGVGRYNHNINTSSTNYKTICSSHSYADRVGTINTATRHGLDICSGVIIGLGEGDVEILTMIDDLKKVNVKSIPVNFFLPLKGHRIEKLTPLTPEYCLRVLALFRLSFPKAEIRAAAGREFHIRSMQALALYPANSVFAQGYLTSGGSSVDDVKEIIADLGFEVDTAE